MTDYHHIEDPSHLGVGLCGSKLTMLTGRQQKCPACQDLDWFARAEKVSFDQWDRPVYLDGWGSGNAGDGYWLTVDDFIDHVLDCWLDCHTEPFDPEEAPAWVWGTEPLKLKLDAVEFISSQLENQEFYEDAFDQVPDAAIKELQVYLDAWTEQNAPDAFEETHKIAVVIPVEEWKKRWEEMQTAPLEEGALNEPC